MSHSCSVCDYFEELPVDHELYLEHILTGYWNFNGISTDEAFVSAEQYIMTDPAYNSYIRFGPDCLVTSRALYEIYREWCADNAYVPMASHGFWSFLMQNRETYKISPTRTVPIGMGKYARGFRGVGIQLR